MPAVDEAVESLLDDPKERLQRLEVVEVVDRGHHVVLHAQAGAVRRAKSAKLIGGLPVTFSTSLLGREPCPRLAAIRGLGLSVRAPRMRHLFASGGQQGGQL